MLAPTASKLATRQLMPHDGGGAGGCQGTLARKGDAGSEKGDAAPEPAATFGNSRKALAIPPLPFLPFRPKRMVTRVPRVVFVKAVVQIHSHTSGGRNCCELGSSLSSGKLLRRLLARHVWLQEGDEGAHTRLCVLP